MEQQGFLSSYLYDGVENYTFAVDSLADYLIVRHMWGELKGKDIDECKFIKKKIEKYNKNVKLIQSKDSEYNAGISIVPSYLAKGLEFDSVMLFNVNDDKYQNTVLDIKLL